MTVTYTSVAKVQKRIENLDSSLATADIETFINHAEGFVDALTKYDWREIFDSTKHAIIESLTTDLAVFTAFTFNTEGAATTSDAALALNALWANALRQINLLQDERVITWLKGKK